jgi:hypothetical protein
VGLGTKNHCAGEDQQQLSRTSVSQLRAQKWSEEIQIRQVVKYDESSETHDKDSLCWRGPAAIYRSVSQSIDSQCKGVAASERTVITKKTIVGVMSKLQDNGHPVGTRAQKQRRARCWDPLPSND